MPNQPTKIGLKRGHMPEHPDLTVWAVPCFGCFRNENEAVWYFRKFHAGSVYTGIEGERKINFAIIPLSAEEDALYEVFRSKDYNRRPVDPLPHLKIYEDEEPSMADYWMKRAIAAEEKLSSIMNIMVNKGVK